MSSSGRVQFRPSLLNAYVIARPFRHCEALAWTPPGRNVPRLPQAVYRIDEYSAVRMNVLAPRVTRLHQDARTIGRLFSVQQPDVDSSSTTSHTALA